MMRRISRLALLGAISFTSTALYAGETAPDAGAAKAEAARRFDRGLQLFNEGDNAGALAEFKQTYAVMPNPIVLFNIGLVYAAMARPVEAVDALTPVIDSATLSAEQRDRAQKVLADQRDRIGRVSVTSVPAGARVDVDGVEVAQTPLASPLRVAVGSHIIGAVAEGYMPMRKEVIVAGNAEAVLKFELVLSTAKRPANLTIRTRLLDAEVVLDGTAIGKTPLASSVSVPAGIHRVELRRPGYRAAEQQLELGEGATGEVVLNPAPDTTALVSEGSDFSVDVPDSGANLTIDEERLGLYAGLLRLPKGRHRVRLEVAGYLPFEGEVTLLAGQPYVLRPKLVPTPETRQAHDSNVRWHRTFGFIGLGVGTALTGTGVTLLVIGSSHKSSADKDFAAEDAIVAAGQNSMGDAPCNRAIQGYSSEQCVAPRDAAEQRIKRANTEKTLGFIGTGLGVAVITTGVVLLATGESSHRFDVPDKKSGRIVGPTFRLAPGPGQVGLGVVGTF